jgi:hypothetical protein
VEQAVGLHMGLAAGGNLITTGLLDSLLMLSYEDLQPRERVHGQREAWRMGAEDWWRFYVQDL